MAEPAADEPNADISASRANLPLKSEHVGIVGRAKNWVFEEGPWWTCSFVFHLVLICSLAMIGSNVIEKVIDEAPSFEGADLMKPIDVPQEIERFEVADAPLEPTELNTEMLMMDAPAQLAQEEQYYDDSSTFSEAGGGIAATTNQPNLGGFGGFDVKGLGTGPAVRGKGGGVGSGVGAGVHPGSGGAGLGFGGRGSGSRKAMLGSGGGTRQSERAVAAALNWIARHQSPDGSWSLSAYRIRCKDPSCTDVFETEIGDRHSAATAMALLPFLAAGQTPESRGPYKKTIYAGIAYLVKNQKQDGDLRMGGVMYDHGLASIALCECYGMTGNKLVGRAAQAALNFIANAQDPSGGGWRYKPREPGDTSVVGWQIMALKSGQMGYLDVNPGVLDRAKGFLKSVSSGDPGSLGVGGAFTYVPDGGATPCMTAVGLLCCQYMGAQRDDPAMIQGTALLMSHPPDVAARNVYYWYYATQVMHNQLGPDWDVWNRIMRRVLINTQCKKDDCTAGSWDPKLPSKDTWGGSGGRLFMTSLSVLTLEVYYRYLPLYMLDKSDGAAAAKKPDQKK